MTGAPYKRPPITEAVIEIRLEDSLPGKMLEKIHKVLSKKYESSEQISSIEFKVDINTQILEKLPGEFEGYKLTSNDPSDILQIKQNSMVCSRLAPYTGWENFEPRARENWDVWRKITGYTRIRRIGVRYLNRIDIPYGEREKIDIEDYLTVVPKYPEPHLITNITNYTMQILGPSSFDGYNLIINTNVVQSPLIDYLSVILDLDLSPSEDIPQRNDKVWEMLNQMREHKNSAFEMCITDRARELFE